MTKLDDLIVDKKVSIKEAIKKIDKNARGICFVLDDKKIIGIATDGDVRRGLIDGKTLDSNISEVMNSEFVKLNFRLEATEINKHFNHKIKLIPLVDDNGNLVDFADAKRGHRIPIMEPQFNGNEAMYLEECISTAWISSQGKFVNQFEKMFETLHPGCNALAVSNGTVALHLALATLGIGPGDEVIVPNLTFAASANAVIYTGATPVLCEIDEESWCIDPQEAGKLITSRTKAIIPVHIYGRPCNMDAISTLAQLHGLFIVEDCAEALGSKWDNKMVGTFGHAAAFSFFGNKTITTGEGGMVLFKDKKYAEYGRTLRDHGMNKLKRYWHDVIGFNYRMTNLQAAIGVAQLERFDEIIDRKRKTANLYESKLRNINSIALLPLEKEKEYNTFWLYSILLDDDCDRDSIMQKLLLNGIETRPLFYPLNLMQPYKNYPASNSLEKSLTISGKGISLPSSLNLDEDEIYDICKALESILFIGNKTYSN